MNKEEFLKKYEENKDFISAFYYYNCLRLSGFDKNKAYDLIDLVSELYLKDESGTSIGMLCDDLYANRDLLDKNFPIRELLIKILENEGDVI